jgi:hypothetical protein
MQLLNALCEPPAKGQPVAAPATEELVERAYVAPDTDVPDFIPSFLLREDEQRKIGVYGPGALK